MDRFREKIKQLDQPFQKSQIEILQVNLGKLCNLACVHCHVEASPAMTAENMSEETAQAIVRLLDYPSINTLDLTGGAPELNPSFNYLVEQATQRNIKVIDRCNLTIFFVPSMHYLPEFLAKNRVEIVASLPCYSRENVDKQSGSGTFAESIYALIWLNELGYGQEGSGLSLNLVYNPVGPHLPPESRHKHT